MCFNMGTGFRIIKYMQQKKAYATFTPAGPATPWSPGIPC